MDNLNDSQNPYPGFLKSEMGQIAYDILKTLVPLDIRAYCKRSIGREYDGGYLVLDKDLDKLEAVYSVGVEYDTSFEEHMVADYPQLKHL